MPFSALATLLAHSTLSVVIRQYLLTRLPGFGHGNIAAEHADSAHRHAYGHYESTPIGAKLMS
jgi:hypothetical protein